jgi:hypothetical protein
MLRWQAWSSRPDGIAKATTVDLVVINALKSHLQPVNYQVRTPVWYVTADIDTVVIGLFFP